MLSKNLFFLIFLFIFSAGFVSSQLDIGYDSSSVPNVVITESTSSGSVGTFLDLTDTPNSYAGDANDCVKVKADESGLEFVACGGGGDFSFTDFYDSFLLNYTHLFNLEDITDFNSTDFQDAFNSNLSAYSFGNFSFQNFTDSFNSNISSYHFITNDSNVNLSSLNISGILKTHKVFVNGTIYFLQDSTVQKLFVSNWSGGGGEDGFIMEYNYNFEAANDDWMIFRKTDGNDDTPDGGIGFVLSNQDGTNNTVFKLDGSGYGNFTNGLWIYGVNASQWLFNQSALTYNFNQSAIPLNAILNPTGSKTFTMSNKQLAFVFTNPATNGSIDGALEIEGLGAFSDDLVHIHQHTGNSPSNTMLLHLEATDPDVIGLYVNTTGWVGANFTTGNVWISGVNVSKWLFNQSQGVGYNWNDSSMNITDLNVTGRFQANKSFYVLNSGRVGINTTTPRQLFEVGGRARIDRLEINKSGGANIGVDVYSVSGGQGLRVETNDSNVIGLSSYVSGDSFVRFSFKTDGTLSFGSGSAGGDTTLYRNSADTLRTSSAFIIDNNLTVTENSTLIGVVNASSTLWVYGVNASKWLFNQSALTYNFNQSNFAWQSTYNITYAGAIYNDTNANLTNLNVTGRFEANKSFYVLSSGRVGIGTKIPVSQLDVNGTIYVGDIRNTVLRKTMPSECSIPDGSAVALGSYGNKAEVGVGASGTIYCPVKINDGETIEGFWVRYGMVASVVGGDVVVYLYNETTSSTTEYTTLLGTMDGAGDGIFSTYTDLTPATLTAIETMTYQVDLTGGSSTYPADLFFIETNISRRIY